MNRRRNMTHAAVGISEIVFLGAMCAAATAPYQVIDLSTLPGGITSSARDMNASGDIVGTSTIVTDLRGFVWNGVMVPLAPLAGDGHSSAVTINGVGQVAGVSFDLGEENVHGFVWSDGTTTDLGSLAPCGINDAGSVAGFRSLSTAAIALADRAALWQGGMVTDLATLGGQFGYATAISNWGQIVGWSFNATHAAPRATLWLNGVVYDLGTLGGAASQAYDVASDAGYVVGVADTAQAKPHAFRLRINAAGTVTSRVDLGELSGGASYAYGVNNNGDVVGTSDSRAFLWRGGAMVDLNTQIPAGAGWTLETARAISDGGRIAGTGRHLGAERAYLLAAVGDIDGDGDVDLGDYGRFSACLGGPGVTVPPLPCTAMDFLVCDVDADGDVDLGDYAAVAAAF